MAKDAIRLRHGQPHARDHAGRGPGRAAPPWWAPDGSDFPNQINNVLVFPGLFKGALSCGAVQITEGMKHAAARALADLVPPEQLSPTCILPSPLNRAAAEAVAHAVAEEARCTGHARF